ncbi:MAG: aromatic ring-hydroxylating dioxygenase subunit alpha [Actinomycetota bacterium]|nr:aromatic ring-hydroxylating dioxygenase subunit alpha [Actinomycetota bacterium]
MVHDVPETGEFMVHRSAFTDGAVLERERRNILSRCWVYVGHASEIPNVGDYRTRSVVGRQVIFCRDRNDEVRVLLNTCRHRGALVCREPQGNDTTFTCFYHKWQYRNSGELIGVPGKISFPESFTLADNGLASASQVETYRDFVFASFDSSAPPLVEYLAGAADFIDRIADQGFRDGMEIVDGAHLYSMRCNWKLVVENSIDGYHGFPVHSTYFQYIGSRGVDLSVGLDGVPRDLGNGHACLDYLAPFARTVARTTAPMSDRAKQLITDIRAEADAALGEERAALVADRSKNIFVYPNLLIIDAASLQIRVLDPVATDYTNISAWLLAPRGEDRELRQIRSDSYQEFLGPGGFATPDDCEALETCQIGYQNIAEVEWNLVNKGYGVDAPEAVDNETQIRAFWRQWDSDMAGGPDGGTR